MLKKSEERKTKQTNDLNDVVQFIKPVHQALITEVSIDSLEYAGDSYLIEKLSKDYQSYASDEEREELNYLYEKLHGADDKDKLVINRLLDSHLSKMKANKFDSLQLLDLKLKRGIEGKVYKDSYLFKLLSNELKAIDLPRLSQAVEMLLNKTRFVTGIKNVLISKRARKGNQNKNINLNKDLILEYETLLKVWAKKMMTEDIESRKLKNLAPRPKRLNNRVKREGSINEFDDIDEQGYDSLPMNELLLMMAETDEQHLILPKNIILDKEYINTLTPDMNKYGTPELPLGLESYSYSASFFYNCIKNKR